MSCASSAERSVDFLVNKRDLHDCRFSDAAGAADEAPDSGEVLLALDKFGLTSNNITYAVLGDAMGYWKFFPAPTGWGRIPVWGYADVVRSRHPQLQEGDRMYGYFPMSTRLSVRFGTSAGYHFVDTSPHRQALPEVYNRYTRASGAAPSAHAEDLQVVYRPLFTTSFLLDDFLADNGFFGARNVVIASASSKTAMGLACLLSLRPERPGEVIGLTAAAHVPFVKGSGCFNRTLSYDELSAIPDEVPTVFVDMAGNAAVVSAVHRHLGERLRYSCKVGLTHWSGQAGAAPPVGVQPILFFAPTQARKRVGEWGAEFFQARSDLAWERLVEMAVGRINIVHSAGHESVRHVYLELLAQRGKPGQGHVLSWSRGAAA